MSALFYLLWRKEYILKLGGSRHRLELKRVPHRIGGCLLLRPLFRLDSSLH